MPVLVPTESYATIVWLGHVADRGASLRAKALREIAAQFEGFEGEAHSGLTRPSCSRVAELYPEGTEVRNTRQVTILSREELGAIAAEMGLTELDPGLLGASMVVEGVPDFSHVPPSSRLQSESGATLVVDLENGPCIWPGKEIEKDHPGFGWKFKSAAQGRRGVTAWVERPGVFRVGARLRLFVPDQPVWSGDTRSR
ncbi:Putative metal-sulfur cluster biosynthesis proteins YuaD [Defluviimonas aquaemixtae]|uniref:Metal-sulfur cluster biosynthesis proteins YuaD n=1 Tax=Albidovulum aquaemixtae TaxID=1542388 RepID=A0A2R8BMG5_9RHOB|nr:MOSC domain-containing protein [Defluviimonas aquaemixtae]SPH24616.1 Putative metal-sulfur cluster biosynthesis proteins YuaD [Defluviimonas aquaemixtae]